MKRRLLFVLLTLSLLVNSTLFAAQRQTRQLQPPVTRVSAVASAEQLQLKFINKQLPNGLEVIVPRGPFNSARHLRAGRQKWIVYRATRIEWLVASLRAHVL